MPSKFDSFLLHILEDIESVASVYGNDGAYDTGNDARIPKVLGPMLRRHKKPRKRKFRK
jgi:hypothetical protein